MSSPPSQNLHQKRRAVSSSLFCQRPQILSSPPLRKSYFAVAAKPGYDCVSMVMLQGWCLTPATAILRLCEGIATAKEGILMPQGSIRTLHGSIRTSHGSILTPQESILMPQGSLLACQASIRRSREGMRPRHTPPLSLIPWPLAGHAGELERTTCGPGRPRSGETSGQASFPPRVRHCRQWRLRHE